MHLRMNLRALLALILGLGAVASAADQRSVKIGDTTRRLRPNWTLANNPDKQVFLCNSKDSTECPETSIDFDSCINSPSCMNKILEDEKLGASNPESGIPDSFIEYYLERTPANIKPNSGDGEGNSQPAAPVARASAIFSDSQGPVSPSTLDLIARTQFSYVASNAPAADLRGLGNVGAEVINPIAKAINSSDQSALFDGAKSANIPSAPPTPQTQCRFGIGACQ